MEEALNYIREIFKDNVDVKYREIKNMYLTLTLVFIDNLCDSKFISEYIVEPLEKIENDNCNMEGIRNKILKANIVEYVKDNQDAIMHILSGDVVILSNKYSEILYCEAKGFVKRSVTIPITQSVIKGPREGFTESFVDNISLLRRKIKNPDLKFESMVIGKKSNTTVVLGYIKDVSPGKLISDTREKLLSMEEEFILDTNYIEEKLRHKKTLFDTIGYSEKPDEVASKLMEGRIAVIVDGTPFVVTIPYFFIENFQTPDDYYVNGYFSNVTRMLRWMAFFIATFLPGLYVAIVTHHFSLIPSVFVFRLAVSRAGVPFPTVIEVIMMMVFFQLIKEAGVRLPQPIGQAMSIVGALILGDAAVGAGLASQITILIVALSTISYFLVPRIYGAVSIWAVALVIFGALLGLPGFYIGFFMLISHLSSLESSGYAYLYPLGSLRTLKYKDGVVRFSLNNISRNLFKTQDKRKR